MFKFRFNNNTNNYDSKRTCFYPKTFLIFLFYTVYFMYCKKNDIVIEGIEGNK